MAVKVARMGQNPTPTVKRNHPMCERWRLDAVVVDEFIACDVA